MAPASVWIWAWPATWPAWALPLLFAPFAGSLLGLLAMRLPRNRPVALARSECAGCRHALGVPDLIPVVSYMLLRGRCRFCGAAIGRAHLWAELGAVAIAAVPILLRPDAPPGWFWCACLLGWAGLLLCWIDLVSMRLPDAITLPLLLAGLAATWARDPDAPGDHVLDNQALGDHALAAACGYLLLRAVALGYRRLRGRDGLGAGDAKLLAAGGAWLGLAGLPWMLFAGAVATLAVALVLRRTRSSDAVPFGPGLAAALWGMFLCMAA